MVCMPRGDKELGATVEGKLRVPSPEDPEAAMPILVILGQPPTPNPVGAEELTGVALALVLVSLGLIAGPVEQPTQVRTRSAPTATAVSSDALCNEGSGANRSWVIKGHS